MLFEKGFGAAKAAESKYVSLTPPNTLYEKINLLSQLPSFVRLVKSMGSNLHDITLTGNKMIRMVIAEPPYNKTQSKSEETSIRM